MLHPYTIVQEVDVSQSCDDAPVRAHRTNHPVPVARTGRQATARRLQAARVLAGRPSLRDRF